MLATLTRVVLAAACTFGQSQTPRYTLLDNVREKLTQENLQTTVILGQPHAKYVPIIAGADSLMDFLISAPQFKRDPIWGRLAHSHPASTIAFREKENPSTHVLFLKRADGSWKADIHLDGNGPQKLFPHLDEFFFHKLTFQDNDQDRMHANLERSFSRRGKPEEDVFITRRERINLYLHDTFGLAPLASAFTNGLFRYYTHQLVWRTEPHYEPMLNRFEGSLFRQGLRNTIELGVASWRQEDTRYRMSGEVQFKNRLRAAVVSTFVVPTPHGREFAYGRFSAIAGTTAVANLWHPWRAQSSPPNYARQATFGMVVDPLVRSLWAEFGPDLKRRLAFHR